MPIKVLDEAMEEIKDIGLFQQQFIFAHIAIEIIPSRILQAFDPLSNLINPLLVVFRF